MSLIPPFTHTPAGRRFAQAWNSARTIVDASGGHRDDEAEDQEEPPAS